jgi:hypothetical protein
MATLHGRLIGDTAPRAPLLVDPALGSATLFHRGEARFPVDD